jgi:N-acyl-D-aspartate/D-glutamate deacylase
MIVSELLTRRDGEHWQRLQLLTESREAGASNLWGLMAVRPLVFQYLLTDPFPFNPLPEVAQLLAEPPAERIARYQDPAWRQAIQAQIDAAELGRWDQTFFAETTRTSLIGRSVADVATEWNVSPLDAMVTVALKETLQTRFRVVLLNDDEDSIDRLLRADGLLVGLSDAGAHATQLCDAPFAAQLLGTFVRERSAISLERAVYKLTGEPAAVLGLFDRGLLKPGKAADVAIFDPATIAPGPIRRVWDFPAGSDRLTADHPEGIVHVLVNGRPIREDGKAVDLRAEERPGTVLGRGVEEGQRHVAVN